MSDKAKGKIQSVSIQNFTCFENVHLDFSTGINVFIGENGTGKTHVLKLLNIFPESQNSKFGNSLPYHVIEKTSDIFKSKLEHLYRDGRDGFECEVILIDNKNLYFDTWLFGSNHFEKTSNVSGLDDSNIEFKLLFIPTQEMLSLYPGFISAYENRENAYDATYFNLAKALNARPLRGEALKDSEKLLKGFEEEIGISVEEKNDQFYVKFKNEGLEIEAPLVAEGIKKLGQLIYLIRNGSLTKDTILLWDEPEVNLNPKYIRLVADFLMSLAKAGVQIFIATHDYLLAHYLSTKAEYRDVTDAPPMKFFSFYKEDRASQVESAETLAEIQNNTLLDEYAALYELEGNLFQQTMKNKH